MSQRKKVRSLEAIPRKYPRDSGDGAREVFMGYQRLIVGRERAVRALILSGCWSL